MIEITFDFRPGRQCWTSSCPFCFGPIEFFLASAMFCPTCHECIPPLYLLVDEDTVFAEETKLDYYKKGQKWIDGEY